MALNPRTAKYRQYIVPEEFQERLNDVGGLNRYDEPNFLVVWGQGGDYRGLYRAGGAWEVEGIPSYIGYRWNLIGGGQSCWCLLQWHSPEEYGTPEFYYVQNWDENTGLQTLGEFPYSGRYQLLYSLNYVERRGDVLHTEIMPLNSYLLDTIIPVIKQAKSIGWEKTKAVMMEMKEREDQIEINRIEDVMRDKAVPFRYGKVSFNRQGCTTNEVDQKMVSMQKNWLQIQRRAKSFNKGISTRDQIEL